MLENTTMQTSGRKLCLLLVFGIAALSASAQSFDCGKAATPFDKFICANRDLSAADSKMAAAYKAALAQLSEEGRRRLVESQRSWLKYERNTSNLDVRYLKGTYSSRMKELEKTLETVGPFKIQSLTMYKAEIMDQAAQKQKTPPDEGDSDTAGSLKFSFPRIESPSTAETERSNRLVEEDIRKFAGELKSGTGVEVDFEITYASQDVISLDLGMWSFSRKWAHPNHAGAGYIVLLRSGRELQASDLFTPTKSWKTFLNGIVFRKLKAQAAKEDWILSPSSAAKLDADAVKRWTITKQGLKIRFVHYEVSSYASGPHEVVVSWAELKPYLKATLPFSVPQP